jgi:hypothetical protein
MSVTAWHVAGVLLTVAAAWLFGYAVGRRS